VLVRGCRAPIAGRIAMDMCMADVTDVPGVAPDDEVVIMGRQGSEAVDADELAGLADTISWEILAGISARVPRVYLRAGRPVAETTLNERIPAVRRHIDSGTLA
jgi:alanine racemase